MDRFAFPAGSTLLLSTGGLTETRAADDTFLPGDERLKGRLDLSPADLSQALYEDAPVACCPLRWTSRCSGTSSRRRCWGCRVSPGTRQVRACRRSVPLHDVAMPVGPATRVGLSSESWARVMEGGR
ncbi:hypothetical protein [Streptomyces sp. NPDC002088]|uniref:hypothetical protein n=1 Tax=Streptomyces sp. NPDC002088 TaxID=3154665 RepID=UPI0033205E4C